MGFPHRSCRRRPAYCTGILDVSLDGRPYLFLCVPRTSSCRWAVACCFPVMASTRLSPDARAAHEVERRPDFALCMGNDCQYRLLPRTGDRNRPARCPTDTMAFHPHRRRQLSCLLRNAVYLGDRAVDGAALSVLAVRGGLDGGP